MQLPYATIAPAAAINCQAPPLTTTNQPPQVQEHLQRGLPYHVANKKIPTKSGPVQVCVAAYLPHLSHTQSHTLSLSVYVAMHVLVRACVCAQLRMYTINKNYTATT